MDCPDSLASDQLTPNTPMPVTAPVLYRTRNTKHSGMVMVNFGEFRRQSFQARKAGSAKTSVQSQMPCAVGCKTPMFHKYPMFADGLGAWIGGNFLYSWGSFQGATATVIS